jgi:BirA family biotin operon repressor/biotin-[acetyl-CoA-carboxylase] ligase
VPPLICLGVVDSTQAFLKRHPELGFCGVVAQEQTSGRGRGSNAWDSRRGAGLWLSARLPAPKDVSPGAVLQSAMSAVIGILTPCGVPLGIKWPNDLVAFERAHEGGCLVKLGGIIGEQIDDCVMLGLGVNAHHAPEMPGRAIPPASLSELGAVSVPQMTDLAASILEAWQNLGTDSMDIPSFRWPRQGDAIRWEDGNGICQGWKPDGRLEVLTKSGTLLLASGEISGMAHAKSRSTS